MPNKSAEPKKTTSFWEKPLRLESLVKQSPLPKNFFNKTAIELARALIGKGLYIEGCLAEIVETEAYLGTLDPASHTFRGPTKRNATMFKEGGHCYVYLSYGINYCMNVVAGPQGLGEAVLLRAAKPLYNVGKMSERRNYNLSLPDTGLLNGPGKLTQGMGIDLSDDGKDFFSSSFKIIDLKLEITEGDIVTTSRIGISKARDLPYRFILKNSPYLSRKYVAIF